MRQLVIVDDEPKTRALLRALVTEHAEGVEIVGEADSVQAAEQLILKSKPDIVLLDVQMGDGLGFDLLPRVKHLELQVIFVTAYNQYVIRALRAGAVDYIEKPINPDELTEALKRTEAAIAKSSKEKYKTLIQALRTSEQEPIAVPTRSGLKYLKVSSIAYVKAEGAYTSFHFDDGTKPLLVSRMMLDIQDPLEQVGFVRPHRSYLINTRKISELVRTDGGAVILTDGSRIPFSKSHKDSALEVIRKRSLLI